MDNITQNQPGSGFAPPLADRLMVTAAEPATAPYLDHVVLTFNLPVDPRTIMAVFRTPDGTAIPATVRQLSPNRHSLVIPWQKTPGKYTLTASCPLLDQNQDGRIGTPADAFTFVVTVPVVEQLFVSPAGDDAADGTVGRPLKTIARALDLATEGTTIYLRAGTHPGGFTVRKKRITIMPHDSERAMIAVGANDPSVASCITVGSSQFMLRRVDVSGGFYYGIKFDIGLGHIENCAVHDTGRDCIKIVPGADDIWISKTEVYRSGLRESNADGIDNVGGDRMVVEDCFIHDVVGYGVFGKGGAIGVRIRRNEIVNALAGIYLGGFTDPAFMDKAGNPKLFESIGCTVNNNTIANTDYAGIGFAGSNCGVVTGNTLINTAKTGQGAIYFAPVTRNFPDGSRQVTRNSDNTIKNNVIESTMPGTRWAWYLLEGSVEGGLTVDNNTYDNGGQPAQFMDVRAEIGLMDLTAWRAQNGFDRNGTDVSSRPDPIQPAD